MSVLDKLVAAVTPEPDQEKRTQVRNEARALAPAGTWLPIVIDQHEQIEQAFAAVKSATDAREQRVAQKRLAVILTGHSVAEEVVLYPVMALGDQKGHSTAAYTEQSAAKVQTAALEHLEPLSDDYFEKLEHLRAAVSHHMYEEESTWFPELVQDIDPEKQALITQRFLEEYTRYAHGAGDVPMRDVDGPAVGVDGGVGGTGTAVGTPGAMQGGSLGLGAGVAGTSASPALADGTRAETTSTSSLL